MKAPRLFLMALAAIALLTVGVAVALADPALPDIPPHRHFIQTPTGDLEAVGPQVCEDPSLQDAFNQFHSNIHIAVTGSTGPDQAAPGLHNHIGADIIAKPCSFQP